MTDWMNRKQEAGSRRQKPRKATMAAGAVLFVQLLMQVLNFFRADLAPLKAEIVKVGESVARIEQRLEDHERRIKQLEQGSALSTQHSGLAYGESQMDKPKRKEKRNEDSER